VTSSELRDAPPQKHPTQVLHRKQAPVALTFLQWLVVQQSKLHHLLSADSMPRVGMRENHL
jgi:hypothetical protein